MIGASSGVKAAQAKVLRALYGIGTDVTVTTKPKPPSTPAHHRPGRRRPPNGGSRPSGGPPRRDLPQRQVLHQRDGRHARPGNTGALSHSEVAQIARLHDVSAAAGGLVLTDNRITLPSASNPNIAPPTSFTVDGTDISHRRAWAR